MLPDRVSILQKRKSMKTLKSALFISLLFWVSGPHLSHAQARPQSSVVCQFSAKPSANMEERDNQKLGCLKSNKKNLNAKSCLKIAQSMEYATSAEEAKQLCLGELRKNPTPQECLQITKTMEFADSADEARWGCLLHMNYNLSKKQCLLFAEDMQYPANLSRAKSYCEGLRP